MKHVLTMALVLMLGLAGGCGDSHESLATEARSTMEQMLSVLEGVKDEASAIKAKPTLKKLAEHLNDINARQSKLPTPTEAQVKANLEKHGKEAEALQQRFVSQMMRIGFDPKLRAALDDLDQTMKMR